MIELVLAAALVTRVGAINWDCSVPSYTFFGHHATKSLGPEKFRDRTPYYAEVKGEGKIDYRFRTLAEYEREMQYAIDAGIDYFAYCWYDKMPHPAQDPSKEGATADPHLHEITRARLSHVKSPLREKLHLCAILVTTHDYSDDELCDLATEMRESWYERVDGKPLVYLFCGFKPIERLRAICRREGVGEIYAVLLDQGGGLLAKADHPQVEALSTYAFVGDAPSFADFVTKAIASNANRASKGLPVIPHFSTGWDPTPRNERPVPWCSYATNRVYQVAKGAADLQLMADRLGEWMAANPASCPTGHVLAFAWNEFEEGGWICPNLDESKRPDSSRCQAFAAAVDSLRRRVRPQ